MAHVSVLGIVARMKEEGESLQRIPELFSCLTSLGLPCLLVMFDVGRDTEEQLFDAMLDVDVNQNCLLWEAQQQRGSQSFEALWPIDPTAKRMGTVSPNSQICHWEQDGSFRCCCLRGHELLFIRRSCI